MLLLRKVVEVVEVRIHISPLSCLAFLTEVPEQPSMFFRGNNLSSCQNKEGSKEGGRDREHVCVLVWVCLKLNGKWEGRFKCDRWWQHSSATLGHKTDLGNCLLFISYLLLPPWRSHFTSCKPPLLLHSRVRQFNFNCPQEVRGKSHCFTLKLVNTNNYFCNLAEWSVRPDITQTVVKTLSLISAVYFCSCRSLQNSYLDIPNRKSLSSSCSWQQSPV